MNVTQARTTKYAVATRQFIDSVGHATNTQILEHLRRDYPELSATTVHRLTARLQSRGVIGLAPLAADGSLRYDAHTEPHDHFSCTGCGGLRDVQVSRDFVEQLTDELGGCEITGQLVIQGTCSRCKHVKEGR